MKLSKTEQTIALLTLSLGKADSENLKPLSIREWNDLSSWLKANDFDPAQLLEERANNIVSNFQSENGFVDRIDGLLNRGTTLAINLEKWERAEFGHALEKVMITLNFLRKIKKENSSNYFLR